VPISGKPEIGGAEHHARLHSYSRLTYETGLRQRINQLAMYEPIMTWSATIDAKVADRLS
jgi:hypothetical protein